MDPHDRLFVFLTLTYDRRVLVNPYLKDRKTGQTGEIHGLTNEKTSAK